MMTSPERRRTRNYELMGTVIYYTLLPRAIYPLLLFSDFSPSAFIAFDMAAIPEASGFPFTAIRPGASPFANALPP